jgi:hypothetical protein
MPQKTASSAKPAGLAAGRRKEPRVTPSQPKAGSPQEKAQIAANSHCLRYYGIRGSGGAPRHLSVRGTSVWIVPVLFTSPGFGVVGEVGAVAVDAASYEVVGATPREEVRADLARLAGKKRDELEAAFHRARKA